ncbi:MAG TPA: transcriptional repressor LexA [Verrucomicrobiales bacterium]|nr:transcriptional repressor LexA [Verrucomicrobiales bacterium]
MLTPRQRQILDYLRREHRRTGIMPTTREIQHYFGFSSQTAAMSHLRALERKGAIRRAPGKARAVQLLEPRRPRAEVVEVPIYGSIAAGLAEEQTQGEGESLAVDAVNLGVPRGSRTFALRVRGDSMIDAQIADGDYVVLEVRPPKHGDVVAALIDGETTLKRYVMRSGRPYLRAENPDYPELKPARELVIQGVMIALLRTLKR